MIGTIFWHEGGKKEFELIFADSILKIHWPVDVRIRILKIFITLFKVPFPATPDMHF